MPFVRIAAIAAALAAAAGAVSGVASAAMKPAPRIFGAELVRGQGGALRPAPRISFGSLRFRIRP